MQWTPGGTSSDIEDRRSEGGGGGGFGGFGFGGGGFGGGRLGLGGLFIVLILSFVFKQNLFTGGSSPPATRQYSGEADRDAGEQRDVQFVSFVLDDAQKTWEQKLSGYRHA